MYFSLNFHRANESRMVVRAHTLQQRHRIVYCRHCLGMTSTGARVHGQVDQRVGCVRMVRGQHAPLELQRILNPIQQPDSGWLLTAYAAATLNSAIPIAGSSGLRFCLRH